MSYTYSKTKELRSRSGRSFARRVGKSAYPDGMPDNVARMLAGHMLGENQKDAIVDEYNTPEPEPAKRPMPKE